MAEPPSAPVRHGVAVSGFLSSVIGSTSLSPQHSCVVGDSPFNGSTVASTMTSAPATTAGSEGEESDARILAVARLEYNKEWGGGDSNDKSREVNAHFGAMIDNECKQEERRRVQMILMPTKKEKNLLLGAPDGWIPPAAPEGFLRITPKA